MQQTIKYSNKYSTYLISQKYFPRECFIKWVTNVNRNFNLMLEKRISWHYQVGSSNLLYQSNFVCNRHNERLHPTPADLKGPFRLCCKSAATCNSQCHFCTDVGNLLSQCWCSPLRIRRRLQLPSQSNPPLAIFMKRLFTEKRWKEKLRSRIVDFWMRDW